MDEVDANFCGNACRVELGLLQLITKPKIKVVTYAFTKKPFAQNLHSSSLSQCEGRKLEIRWNFTGRSGIITHKIQYIASPPKRDSAFEVSLTRNDPDAKSLVYLKPQKVGLIRTLQIANSSQKTR